MDPRKEQALRLMKIVVAFNEGERAVAELVGEKKSREIFKAHEEAVNCRKRAATNRKLLDMRLD